MEKDNKNNEEEESQSSPAYDRTESFTNLENEDTLLKSITDHSKEFSTIIIHQDFW